MKNSLKRFVLGSGLTGLLLPLTAVFAADGAVLSTVSAERFDRTTMTIEQLAALPTAPRKASGNYEIPNRFDNHPVVDDEKNGSGPDSLAPQGESGIRAPIVGLSADGPSSDDNASLFSFRIMPPDTNGDVGKQYVVSFVNLLWSMYDKTTGAKVAGPFAGNAIWAGFGGVCESDNAGDPVVLYDHLADRWVFSQFTSPNNPDGHQCFAVTQGSDPRGPYNRYDVLVSPGEFNDYPKVGMWSDGAGQSAYTMTSRQFVGNSWGGIDFVVLNRDAMLAGTALNGSRFQMPTNTADAIQPAHLDSGPATPAGTCPIFAVADGSVNAYHFWEVCANFVNPLAATVTDRGTVATVPFDDNVGNIPVPSPGSSLDSLSFFTMYRFANRYYPGSGLFGAIAHTVDAGADRAGMRWAIVNLSNPASISVADTGTYAPNDGRERWMGSAALDSVGNLGLAYTRASSSSFPSVYFTGRETTDPAGTLQSESVCVNGTGVQTGGDRWGDYSSISVDPVDGCTFWAFQEYVKTTGNFDWDTRICKFSFPSCGGGTPDAPVPDVKINGQDELVTGSTGSSFNLTFALDAAGHAGEGADVLIGLMTRNAFIPIFNNAMLLSDIPEVSIYNGPLAAGVYVWVMAVDLNPNGVQGFTYTDLVPLVVTGPGAPQADVAAVKLPDKQAVIDAWRAANRK